MNGFKDGSVDGWDDDEDSAGDDLGDGGLEADGEAHPGATREPDPEPTREDSRGDGPRAGRLPWIHSRSSITDGREKTVQLHLQQSTADQEREQATAVEQVLGDDVKKADLREAALIVGLDRVDDVADVLREWGYDIE